MVKLVEWKSKSSWIDDDVQPLAFLLTKCGRYLGADGYADFTVHNYADFSFERPWIFYEQLKPLIVNDDGGIMLRGVGLGHDAERPAFGALLDLGPERSLWGVLRWLAEPGLDTDYAISLRFYNAEGERAFQQDAVLWNPDHRPTSNWTAGEPVKTPHSFNLPSDLPPGDYELRLVVYDFETQVPTVRVDVRTPEITLAGVRLSD